MKKLAVVAVAGVAALVARRYAALRPHMAAVAPEMRTPLLALAPTSFSGRTVKLFRMQTRWLPVRSEPGAAVTQRQVGEPAVDVLVTTPDPSPEAVAAVLWIHGGGYVLGSPKMEASAQRRLTKELGVVVVAPFYRLAPEHPFPAALDDCMTALRWMLDSAAELGIDPNRVAVMGASAGGGLSAAVAQRSHDEGIRLRAQVLSYPMIDDRSVLRERDPARGVFLWTAAANRFGWTSYLGREPRESDAPEYAAPARRTDLAGLPPAWVGVGELDLFYDEDVAYAERLKACGVPCELVTVPRMYHGADGLAAKAPAMQEFRRSMLEHLRVHL